MSLEKKKLNRLYDLMRRLEGAGNYDAAELDMIRAPEKTNEQIADNVREMVLTGLYELEGKADDGK